MAAKKLTKKAAPKPRNSAAKRPKTPTLSSSRVMLARRAAGLTHFHVFLNTEASAKLTALAAKRGGKKSQAMRDAIDTLAKLERVRVVRAVKKAA